MQACASADAEWQGFAVSSRRPEPLGETDVLAATPTGWQLDLTGRGVRDWETTAQRLLLGPNDDGTAYVLTYGDEARCVYRAAAFHDDVLIGALLVAPSPLIIARDWLVARLGTVLGAGERFRLLDGRPSGAMIARRRVVCYCHQIGDNEILEAIQAGCASVSAIGEATRAGTNCGNCQPRIAAMLQRASVKA